MSASQSASANFADASVNMLPEPSTSKISGAHMIETGLEVISVRVPTGGQPRPYSQPRQPPPPRRPSVNFTPNPEQIKSIVRWFVTAFGASIAGWFAAKGWLTSQQVLDILNSPVVGGLVVSAVAAVWGLFTHTQNNAVAVVDKMPEVAGVVTKATNDGQALAAAAESQTVAVEGTVKAQAVAAK